MGLENGVIIPTPARIQIVSPSSGGKTTLAHKILTSNVLHPPPKKIFVVYSFYQPCYDKLKRYFGSNIQFFNSLPDELCSEKFLMPNKESCLLLDDCLTMQNEKVLKLVAEASHHCNLTVLLLQQSLYPRSAFSKMISDQMTDVFVFKNPRDTSRLKYFAQQCFPQHIDKFVRAFEAATSEPYGYLWICFNNQCPREMQLRSNAFAEKSKYMQLYLLNPPLNQLKKFAIVNNNYVCNDEEDTW